MKLDVRRFKVVLVSMLVGVFAVALPSATAAAKSVEYAGSYGAADSADGGQLWLTVTSSRAKPKAKYTIQYAGECGQRSIEFGLRKRSSGFTVTQSYPDGLRVRIKASVRGGAVTGTVRAYFTKKAATKCDTGIKKFRAPREPAPRPPAEVWTPDFS